MRLLFAGTPEVALPALDRLLAGPHEVVAVLTRPDAARRSRPPHGRQPGRRARAEAAGLEVLRPPSPRDPDFQRRLAELAPDCAPVVAYGALLPEPVLDVPAHGWVNLHFSLLPAWRGAAPVQHALLAGDEVTGATTFRIVEALDAGPVLGTATESVRPADTAGDLLGRLAISGAELLAATLDGLEAGRLEARRAAGRRRHRSRPASPSTTPGCAGTTRRSPSTGGSAPAPRRPGRGRPWPASGSSSARSHSPTPATNRRWHRVS